MTCQGTRITHCCEACALHVTGAACCPGISPGGRCQQRTSYGDITTAHFQSRWARPNSYTPAPHAQNVYILRSMFLEISDKRFIDACLIKVTTFSTIFVVLLKESRHTATPFRAPKSLLIQTFKSKMCSEEVSSSEGVLTQNRRNVIFRNQHVSVLFFEIPL